MLSWSIFRRGITTPAFAIAMAAAAGAPIKSLTLGSTEEEVDAAAETATELRPRRRFSAWRQMGGRAHGKAREARRRNGLSAGAGLVGSSSISGSEG
jgi:hypothetical protein